ncbi:hypothetical protein [Actinomyces sp. oral taxon 180]|uniref:hypothetical protein n=1 Tax=Actinomyces sp. oral taxon 180 TaxID=651609 RepID=UPI0001F11499|nr:hypothetical protein [Actinomyces sp. oral taxon 180]EFU61237.1 hypothetical protein HMPREF9006_0937 [Actinomyces sp. oral taxon 180 str. F0310]
MTIDDHASQERYVALYAWLCGQMSPRAPHAADLFEQDRECLYDAFLSVLVGTRLGFADYDDNQAHHGLYAFDFFVGDLEAPSCRAGVDGARGSGVAGESAAAAATPAMCHAIVDTWLGDTSARIPFVASVIASVATLELVADVRVDECVFECDLPPEYARCTANMPWEDGSLPIGALDLSLVAPGPLIYVEAGARYARQPLSCSGFDEALASCVQMGLAVESSMASGAGVAAALRAPHGGPEMLGWAADTVARALSACGHTGGVQIRTRFAHAPA